MKNPQEDLNNVLSENSLGAPFIFMPDEYTIKDGRVREPADIAWIANGGIILMYMCLKKPHEDVEVNKQRFNKLIEHNLVQAGGWLKEWKAGRPLTGKHPSMDFNIKYENVKNVIVLSIVDNNVHNCIFHEEFVQEHDIKICVTLPQSAFEYFASKRFGVIDLIRIFFEIKKRGNADINALDLIKEYYSQVLDIADKDRKWLNDADEKTRYLSQYLFAKENRSVFTLLQDKTVNSLYNYSYFFNDMPLCDMLHILTTLREDLEKYDQDNSLSMYKALDLEYYVCITGVAHIQNHAINIDTVFEKYNDIKNALGKPVFVYIYSVYFGNLGSPLIMIKDSPSESHFELLLKHWY